MANTPSIRLTTLGAIRCSRDGIELEALTAQPRRAALFIYLAVAHPREFHTRDRLLALFWPDHDDHRARNALSQAVHFLRRLLGAEALVSAADDRLRADANLVWCDVAAFEESLGAGRLDEALGLYKGPFLDGFHIGGAAAELDHWVDGERTRLAALHARALEQKAGECECAGDVAGAVIWWRRLAVFDPLSSRTALALMRALIASGESESALQHARVHETLVREDLQAAPDPAIAALARELRTGAVTSTPNGVSRTSAANSALTREAMQDRPADGAPTPALHESNGRRWRGRRVGVAAAAVLASALVIVPVARRRAESAPRLACVAVLPLENISGDTALEYFAESVTGAMITELGRYERPQSRSRPSVLSFKGTHKPVKEIGRTLNCDGIVGGSVTRHGPVVHVDVQAVYAPEDRNLWAESFENDSSQMLLLERLVRTRVAEHMLSLAGVTPLEAAPPERANPLVYHLYLQGRDAFRSRNPAMMRQAIAFFQQAIGLDSSFALAYAGLADAYGFTAGMGYGPLAYFDSSRATVARALALDSTVSDAHATLGSIYFSDGDWERAEAEFKKAVQLEHGNALAHHWYAMLLAVLDRREEALTEIRIAAAEDSKSQPINGVKIQIEFLAGVKMDLHNPGNGRGVVDPTHPGTHIGRGVGLAQHGRCPEAYREIQTADHLAPDNAMTKIGLVSVHLLCGNHQAADRLLTEVARRPDAPVMAAYIAPIYAYEHKPDSAFAWLNRARWHMGTFYQLRVDHNLDPLRAEPRFAQLLQRLRIPATAQ